MQNYLVTETNLTSEWLNIFISPHFQDSQGYGKKDKHPYPTFLVNDFAV